VLAVGGSAGASPAVNRTKRLLAEFTERGRTLSARVVLSAGRRRRRPAVHRILPFIG